LAQEIGIVTKAAAVTNATERNLRAERRRGRRAIGHSTITEGRYSRVITCQGELRRALDVGAVVKAYLAGGFAWALAVGCASQSSVYAIGGDPDGDPAGEDGRDGKPSTNGNPSDGGTPKDADVGPPPVPKKVGRILVGQTLTIVGAQQYYSSYATAMFYENPDVTSGPSCTYSSVGGCHVYDCPLGGPVPDAGGPRYAAGGSVSITGGFTTYTMNTKAGSYETVSSQARLYDSGTVLRASSTGGEVPAFSNKTLTVPSVAFNVQSPALGASLTLSRTQALGISWSGAGDRDVHVNISTTQQNVHSVAISCVFPGNQNGASIPAAAMGKLKPTNTSMKGYLSIGAPTENTWSAGEWVVTFGLNGSPAGSAFTTTN
jgi:hypothetical protein